MPGRAPNGASSIYQGSDGAWHGRVTMGARDDGRPDRRHVRAKTRAEVTRKVRELEKQRDSGHVTRPGRPWTLAQWLTHWVDTIAAPAVRFKTLEGYRTAVHRHLIPGLGAHRLDRVQPEHFEKLYARMLAGGLSAGTAHQVHRAARTALNEAVRRGHIARNPVRLAKPPRLAEAEVEPLSVEDVRQLLAAALDRRNGTRFALALALGLRKGEALGLQWRDVDLDAGTLVVRRALQRRPWQHGCGGTCGRKRGADCPDRHGGGLVEVEVKSRAGRRGVGLPDPLVDLLRTHREAQAQERRRAGQLWTEGGWVFAQPTGRPIDPRADHDEWKALLTAAGVRDARLHDARHTAATVLLLLGVPDRTVMGLMGWSQSAMTVRYQHLTAAIRRDVAGQVGNLLWSAEGLHG
jgi:integrase